MMDFLLFENASRTARATWAIIAILLILITPSFVAYLTGALVLSPSANFVGFDYWLSALARSILIALAIVPIMGSAATSKEKVSVIALAYFLPRVFYILPYLPHGTKYVGSILALLLPLSIAGSLWAIFQLSLTYAVSRTIYKGPVANEVERKKPDSRWQNLALAGYAAIVPVAALCVICVALGTISWMLLLPIGWGIYPYRFEFLIVVFGLTLAFLRRDTIWALLFSVISIALMLGSKLPAMFGPYSEAKTLAYVSVMVPILVFGWFFSYRCFFRRVLM